ncbi:5-methylcytosine restriction system specificity protein McrC [Flectobacillus major]|uniref:5-methylcytosine restriction system specificity protein McrC n=1 Tax=Flectobacillus major TaxID=103 RepID=UPI0003FC1FB5|nr:hypothetical protein [Flectobacillus major]
MIPIENIYFLLCYAWNRLEQRNLVLAGTAGQKDIYELLCSVLLKEIKVLWQKGYFSHYNDKLHYFQGIKGKINLNQSLLANAFPKGYAYCEFDEYSSNILVNQVLKTSLIRLTRIASIPATLHRELQLEVRKLSQVDEIQLHQDIFPRAFLQCQRDTTYTFLLHICELLFTQSMISEKGDEILFRDFFQDEKKMAYLFEDFTRNFYKIELKGVRVFRERLHWQLEGEQKNYLPKMQTDISMLFISGRKIIIDTKYYTQTLSSYFSTEKIHTENLYQLFAYLKNQSDPHAEGILLYPTVKQHLSLRYSYESHQIRVETINLAQPWQAIHSDLLKIVEENTNPSGILPKGLSIKKIL